MAVLSSSFGDNSEVLVVGGGMAALMAALAAREEGRNVAVISAAAVGGSGNTIMIAGGISGATDDADNTPELFARDVLTSGKGVCQPDLVRALAADSPAILDRLAGYGVPLQRQGGSYHRTLVPGHSAARNISADLEGGRYKKLGQAFMAGPLARLRALGAPVESTLRAARIVTDDAGVAGVIAYDREAGACRFIRSRRVVLATGGYCGLFWRTNNIAGSVGDGLALALNAGAALRDMEMVQYLPTMMFDPVKLSVTNRIFGSGGVLRNSEGERFLSRYDPAGDMATRDIMARAIFHEVQAGRGIDGCVYIDCTAIPEDELNTKFSRYAAQLAKHGIDIRKEWFKGTPCAHYSLGGICIDSDGRTGVTGLYAAGEVAGGVHGVNRLGGAAMTEACVFGRRAGLAAAADDLAAGPSVTPPLPDTSGYGVSAGADGAMKELRSLMWEHVSLARDERGLLLARDGVVRLRDAEQKRVGGAPTFFAGSLLVAEAVIAAALARTESRGAHYRIDYPETDPAWERSITCTLQNGGVYAVADQT